MAKQDKVKTPKSKKTKHAKVKGGEADGGKTKEAEVEAVPYAVRHAKVKGGEADGGKTKEAEVEAVPYAVRMAAVTVISKPMADEKKTKKFYKLVKKAAKDKIARRGVKEVCKGIRQGKKGICIIAGDISPIDVISHMAYYCEEQGVDYIYVPSKVDLGAAAKTKRPTSCVLITPPKETKDKVWDPSTKTLFGQLKEVCALEMTQVPTMA